MSDTPKEFVDWLRSQVMPGTVISNPEWWAPRIYRKAIEASGFGTQERELTAARRDAQAEQAAQPVALRHFDAAMDCAIAVGKTQSGKAFGTYTERDAIVERAMHQAIAGHRRALIAASAQGERNELHR
jgi:hypothetical protein